MPSSKGEIDSQKDAPPVRRKQLPFNTRTRLFETGVSCFLLLLAASGCISSERGVAGSSQLMTDPVRQKLEQSKEANLAQVLLVPRMAAFLIPVSPENIESVACVYESSAGSAITALSEILLTMVSPSTTDAKPRNQEMRIAVLLQRGLNEWTRYYSATIVVPGQHKLTGMLNESTVQSDLAIQDSLKQWTKRSDVKRVRAPVISEGADPCVDP